MGSLCGAQSEVFRVAADSELAEEWGESEDADQWRASLADLRARLDPT